MTHQIIPRACCAIIAGVMLAPTITIAGDPIEVSYDTPSLDRWMYPFNATPGVRISASTFGTVQDERFDNRDGQLIVAYDTGGDITPDLGAERYDVIRARLILQNDTDAIFLYDDTQDPYGVFLPEEDEEYVEDVDPGQPVELFGTGFRNGLSRKTFEENTPYNFGPPLGQQIRNAFALGFDAEGDAIDVSVNVRDRFDPTPWAIGLYDDVAPGDRVPLESEMILDIDVDDPGIAAYLAESLNDGHLFFCVTSLTFVGKQKGEFPQFYCKEHPIVIDGFAFAARLELEVEILDAECVADIDGDSMVGFLDLLAVLSAWGPCKSCDEDLDDDGMVGFSDVLIVLADWGPCL